MSLSAALNDTDSRLETQRLSREFLDECDVETFVDEFLAKAHIQGSQRAA